MKCVCGYESEHDTYSNDYENGEFIRVEGNYSYWVGGNKTNDGKPTYRKCSIYACPKCGTLKIDV